jgi:hypothetical protein
MARYIARNCPKCSDSFWVTVSHPMPQSTELPITAYCSVCGYRLKGWRLILGRKRVPDMRWARILNVLRR